MKKYFKIMGVTVVCAVLFCSLFLFAGCGKQNVTSALEDTTAINSSKEITETEPQDTEAVSDTEGQNNAFSAEGRAFLSSIESYDMITWLEEDMDESWTELFEAYNGEQIQRIARTEDDSYSPAVCPDVVFCRAEQEESPEEVVKSMIDVMILPLTKPSDVCPFTITDYEIGDQELIPLKNHVWILPDINGYYSYEGMDLVSMDEYTAMEPDLEKNGMMPFQKQADDGEFIFILMEQDGVYRLQRAQNMISE